MRPGAWLLIGAAIGCAGCGRPLRGQPCRVERESVLADTREVPTAVAVAVLRNREMVAAWSADGATFVSRMDAMGRPKGRAHKVVRGGEQAAPMAGGEPKSFWAFGDLPSFASIALGLGPLGESDALLFAIERPLSGMAGTAYAARLRNERDELPVGLRLGGAGGAKTDRVAFASRRDRITAAWQSAAGARPEIALADVAVAPWRLVRTARFTGGGAPSSLALAAVGEASLLAYAEPVQGSTSNAMAVRTMRIGSDFSFAGPTDVAVVRLPDPAPALVARGERHGLLFRDDADSDKKAEFYFSLLDRAGRPLASPRRISQADGDQGLRVTYGHGLWATAVIRSSDRNWIVGFNRFDDNGTKVGSELQVYADPSDFIRVDIAPTDAGFLLVYAEDRRGSGRVLASEIVCR